MPKSELSRRIDARPGLDSFYDDNVFDTTEDSAPNTPSGVSVRAVVDGILIQVDFLVDTAHLHPRFQAFVVYAKPIGTASSEPLEVARFSDSSYVWQQPRGGYTGWQIALSAVSNTGYESALTSYYNCIISTFFDDFANYGGAVSSATENLWWLKIATCESAEAWYASGDIGTVSDDTTYFVEGAQGKRMTSELTAGTYYGSLAYEWTPTTDLSVENRFTTADYITVAIYASIEITGTIYIAMASEWPNNNFFRYDIASLAAGWNYIKMLKSDFVTVESPDWASIGGLLVYAADAGDFYFTADAWHIVKADPDDAAAINTTGYAWDFSDGTWLALSGDRSGEPSYAYALAQIESPADDDYLGQAVNVGVPNGIVSAGIMLKTANGAAGLVFRVEDDTLGSEDGLTVELNTTANTLTLNQYAAGAKTELSSVSYTCDPDITYFVGVDFRDPQHQNRVDVYVATTEYELFTGDAMKLSYSSDTPWPNGQGVGVITHACNCRFVNFRAGSPMTADYAHRAGVALKALVAIPGSIAHADLSSVTEDQHHTAFVGLADNADAAINPDDADDRIQVTDDGMVNADAAGNTLALSIATAAPGTIEPDDAADAGVAVSLARSDHQHAIAAAAAGTIQPDDAAAEGVATSFARSDHTHAIGAAAPDADSVNVAASAEGDSTSFARADHTHNLDESIAPTWTGVHIHSNADVKLQSLTDLIVFSDAGVTEKARVDGATGNITTAGTVDTVDVSAFKTTYDAHDHSAADPTQVGHANLTGVSADQHHAGFIGLEDNAGTAVTPAADDRIQVKASGGVSVTAGANILTIGVTAGAGGVDHGGLDGLADDDHTGYALLAGRAGGQVLYGGTDGDDSLDLRATSGAPGGGTAVAIGTQNTDAISIGATSTNVTISGNIADTLNIRTNVWRIGETVLSMDFTGTSFDTDPELQAYGVRLSDVDTPFPAVLVWTVSGTLGHTASTGWTATSSGEGQGPAMLIPIMRPGNWELDVTLTYSPGAVGQQLLFAFGYITASNHVGAMAEVQDTTAAANQLVGVLYTNDGDDTYTARYTGGALAGTGDRLYKFRCKSGCVSMYDEQDDAWHDYTGHQTTTVSYTPAYAFLQFYKYNGVDFATTYVKNLSLIYLL